jgi:hypothetical protein
MSNRERVEVPTDAAELVLARKLKYDNKNPSVEVDSTGTVIPRKPDGNNDGYTVMIRKSKNDPLGDRPRNAKSLKACKGLKGCEFAECAKGVFGKLPKNLAHLEENCSTLKI